MAKNIVVTGAGAGLGKYLSLAFAEQGHNVFLLGRTLSKVESLAKKIGPRAVAICCDITSSDSVGEAFSEISAHTPTIDILVNNAAITGPGDTVENATDAYIHSIFDTHLTGAVFCIRAALPMMPRGSQIINISSDSVGTHFPHHVIYSSSKAGLEHLSERLQLELNPKGIRVTLVRAGPMMGNEDDTAGRNSDPEIYAKFYESCANIGLDLRSLPLSHYESTMGLFLMLIDLPPDVHVPVLHFTGWQESSPEI